MLKSWRYTPEKKIMIRNITVNNIERIGVKKNWVKQNTLTLITASNNCMSSKHTFIYV